MYNKKYQLVVSDDLQYCIQKEGDKNKFKQQEHRSFIDWFIAVPAKITRSEHQTELKMYERYFYKVS